ncbi:TIGR02186 family protein [Thalassospira sp.]|uniref:TIGR02186 family protein n=1 Tax=Thalassospira sp. TaxID=1912094 RepID=UPI0032F0955C
MAASLHKSMIVCLTAFVFYAIGHTAKSASADPLVVDLSNHLVAITTGFTGTDVLLFGAVQNEGDVIVTVRGPDQDMIVRQKERKVGIWINSDSARYKNVPAYYASASNRPIEIIAPENVLKDYRIGLEHQRFIAESGTTEIDQKVYREALVRNMQNAGLFNRRPAKISFLSNQLFRTDIHFPANTPTGTYTINVYLIRDGRIASVKTTPLVVSKTGVSAAVYDFAHRYSALYGIIAVIIAIIAGWIASVAFRKR